MSQAQLNYKKIVSTILAQLTYACNLRLGAFVTLANAQGMMPFELLSLSLNIQHGMSQFVSISTTSACIFFFNINNNTGAFFTCRSRSLSRASLHWSGSPSQSPWAGSRTDFSWRHACQLLGILQQSEKEIGPRVYILIKGKKEISVTCKLYLRLQGKEKCMVYCVHN